MQHGYLYKLHLLPRYHTKVEDSLNDHSYMHERYIDFNPPTAEIQTSLLALVQKFLLQLRKCKQVDVDSLAKGKDSPWDLFRDYTRGQLETDPILREQVGGNLDGLSETSRRCISDLGTLNQLLFALADLNSVQFYLLVESILSDSVNKRLWPFQDEGQNVIQLARGRVYSFAEGRATWTLESESKVLELFEYLRQISSRVKRCRTSEDTESSTVEPLKVLVVCHSERAARSVKTALKSSPQGAIRVILRRTMKSVISRSASWSSWKLPFGHKEALEAALASLDRVDVHEELSAETVNASLNVHDNFLQVDSGCETGSDSHTARVPLDIVCLPFVSPVSADLGYVLRHERPDHVVLLQPMLQFVREVEVWAAESGQMPTVAVFMFRKSAEHHRFLTAAKAENDAWDGLLRQKKTLVIRTDEPSLLDDSIVLSSREAGGGRAALKQALKRVIKPTVIVDHREFRSALPFHIHRQGIDVVPATLVVGDYVVSREVCIERKTISDLNQSLKSGRLYIQTRELLHHYPAGACLLIEFQETRGVLAAPEVLPLPTPDDEKRLAILRAANRPVSFLSSYGALWNQKMTYTDAMARLVLLILHFPYLKLIWSPHPSFTAEFVKEIKTHRENPNPDKAKAVGQISSAKLSSAAQDVLRNLPGVNPGCVARAAHELKSLKDLACMTQAEIEVLVGNPADATTLHRFLHCKLTPETKPD
ncbi:MAG: LOW QUALITY PROTEIN: hypothetical protein KVP17_001714 [Porospora cf. gigantea B]|uniref:uncharacterized protein n=1 Tax=Porospora cf. gigantea B TaxID=2853592 RepID=UPI0035719277|nr:MAG: LOW QUALITY PROTEIN: hypothetical protein KVP17_001714 [Porospora cf. gigantea B]